MYFILWAFISILLTVSTIKLALKKGQSPYFWAVATLLFGFFALIALSCIPSKKTTLDIAPIIAVNSEMQGPVSSGGEPSFSPSLSKEYQMWYYLNKKGKAIGPMSKGALIECLSQGTITKQSFVWSDHMEGWEKMLDVSNMLGS